MTETQYDDLEILLKNVSGILTKYDKDRTWLIPILQDIQDALEYLPEESFRLVGEHLGISACQVYGVATFYNQFRFHPPGRRAVKVCLGTACYVRGADIILENFKRKLEISEGETTPDREYSLDEVACVGCCALAPVVTIGDAVYEHMAPSKVEGLLLRFSIEDEKERLQNEPA